MERMRNMRHWKSSVLVATFAGAAAMTGFAAPAHALAVVYGTDNQLTDNVIYNACDASVKITNAQEIQGCMNSNKLLGVRFKENSEAVRFDDAGGGQATVRSVDANGYNAFLIWIPGHTFNKLDINFEFIDPPRFEGLLNVYDHLGNSVLNLNLEQSGNFSKFVVSGGPFAWLEFLVHDQEWFVGQGNNAIRQLLDGVFVKQIRIGGICAVGATNCGPGGGNEIPEPESLPMVLGGLAVLGAILRRRRKQA
jgi:hypothetical protein